MHDFRSFHFFYVHLLTSVIPITFFIIDNCDMSGNIPNELKVLQDLKFLDLSSNNLVGEVPSELSLLEKLGELNGFFILPRRLSPYECTTYSNTFSLSSLEIIFLSSNRLSGNIPKQLCVNVNEGNLETIEIDCGRESDITCDTSCCQCKENNISAHPLSGSWDYNQKATWTTLKTLSGDKIYTVGTPQYNAAHWIIEQDKWTSKGTTSFLYQRYVLVLLYFMMGNDSDFRPDNGTNECLWDRVKCNDENHVVQIIFGKFGRSEKCTGSL